MVILISYRNSKMFCIWFRYQRGSSGLSQFGSAEQTVVAGLKDTFHKINENSDSFPPFFLVQVRNLINITLLTHNKNFLIMTSWRCEMLHKVCVRERLMLHEIRYTTTILTSPYLASLLKRSFVSISGTLQRRIPLWKPSELVNSYFLVGPTSSISSFCWEKWTRHSNATGFL